ncbi:hypothetical protein Tco_0398330 [Tanacetum coccineum]
MASRLRRNLIDMWSVNGFDELLPLVLVVVSDLLFLAGRVALSGPRRRGLASLPNSSSWPTLGTCSPLVRSTGSTGKDASHFAWDLKIFHASF